jgi:polyphenol oxidase
MEWPDMSTKGKSLGHRKIKEFNGARREFLAHAGFAAGTMVILGRSPSSSAASFQDHEPNHNTATGRPFEFKMEPHRQRKSFYDLNDDEVRLLCRAIGYMRNGNGGKDIPANKAMSVDSPIQWDQWAMTHARHCTESKPGVVDQVHWSWFFLPWHRAYLWFLERQLANIVTTILGGDGSKFALPYWDWIAHKEIPNTKERAAKSISSPLFGYDLAKEDMVHDDGLGFDNLALWDGYRKPNAEQPTMDPKNERTLDSKEHIEETILFMSPQYIQYMLELDFEDFAGKAVPPQSSIPNSDGMGVLENYPHNNGHDWVGSRVGKNRDMGTLRYAALDPIFFMHHANIDRIWSWYRGVQPDLEGPWGPNKYVWGKQPYTFIDIDGSPVTVTVADIVTSMSNVTYLEPSSSPAAMASLSSALPGSSQQRLKEQTVTFTQEVRTLTMKPLTLSVRPQGEATNLLSTMIAAQPRPLSLLVIETGPVTYTGKFTIKVFVNKPDADSSTSIHDPHYVGRVRALDSEGRVNEIGKDISHTFSIIIPPDDSNFYKIVRPGEAFSVTLAALGPSSKDDSFRIEVKAIRLKVFQK